MSRSYKKNMGSTIACCKNIKDDRTIYHKLERAKSKSQLKHLTNDPEDEAAQDKIIKEKIDYNIVWADTWNWSSDGGSYLIETDKDLRIAFEKMLSDDTMFERYKNSKRNKKKWFEWEHYSDLKELAVKIAPANLHSNKQLKKWISKNKKKIISVYKKTHYGK